MRHREEVSWLSFNPSGDLLASSSYDRTVVIWIVETEQEIREFMNEKGYLAVSFSPSGELLAATTLTTIEIWNWEKNAKIHEIYIILGHGVTHFTSDGRYISTGGVPAMFDLQTCKNVPLERQLSQAFYSQEFSPDDAFVSIILSAGARKNFSGRVSILNRRKNEILLDIRVKSPSMVSFSNDGRHVMVGWLKGTMILDLQGRILTTFKVLRGENFWFYRFPVMRGYTIKAKDVATTVFSPFFECKCQCTAMALSRRGFLAIGDRSGRIEIIREGKEI